MKKSLMAKLMVSTGLLVLSIVLIISAISFKYSSTAIEKEVETNLMSQLTGLIGGLETEQANVEDLLHIIGDMPVVKDLKSSRLSTEENQSVNSYLKAFKESNDAVVEAVFIADESGDIIADSQGGSLKGISISDRAYFGDAKKGNALWSEIVNSKDTNELVRMYVYPVKNSSSNTIGYLAAAVKMKPVMEEISKIKVGELGYAYMIDESGLIIAHPNEEYVMHNKIGDMGIPELSAAESDMVQGKMGKIKYTHNNIAKLNMYAGFGPYSISINAAQSEYLAPVKSMQKTIMFAGFVMFILGMTASFILSRYIVRRINKMKSVMLVAAEGDLTVHVDQVQDDGDEIHQISKALNFMLSSFNQIVTDIIKTSEVLSTSSQQMAASAEEGGKAASDVTMAIQEISRGVEVQANDVMSTRNLVGDMKMKLDASSNESRKIFNEAEEVMKTAENSQNLIYDTIDKMAEIKVSSEKTIDVINKLNEQSDKINRISDTIAAIADQTNLLALNAAIEAARAGEAGKGFAVVAEEIRKLANDSQTSANGINLLINEIQIEIHEANNFTQAESEAIEQGVIAIDNTGNAFSEILKLIAHTSESIELVVNKINETQSLGDSVNASVENISDVMERTSARTQEVSAATEEQTAVSEEIAAASEHLSKMATSLFEQVSQYRV